MQRDVFWSHPEVQKCPFCYKNFILCKNHQFRRRKPQSFFFSTVNGLLKPPDNTIHLNLSDECCLDFLNSFNIKIVAIHQNLTYSDIDQKKPCSLNTLGPPQTNVFCEFSLPAESHIWISSLSAIPQTHQLYPVPTSLIKVCLPSIASLLTSTINTYKFKLDTVCWLKVCVCVCVCVRVCLCGLCSYIKLQ